MNIRKIFTKITLTFAAFFWASCSEDGSSEQVVIGPVSDCNDDGSLNNGDVSSNCGGGMIALYGVAPVFDESSSSVTSSDSCEQGCDEMLSSSSEGSSSSMEGPNSSSAKVDKDAALARGQVLCEEHGGVEHAIQYEPPWGSPETRGESQARFEAMGKIDSTLESKKLSSSKKRCLENVKEELDMGMVALYGAPMFDNPNDIWKYDCKDGESVMDEKYKELYDADVAAVEAAKQEHLAEFQKSLDKCN